MIVRYFQWLERVAMRDPTRGFLAHRVAFAIAMLPVIALIGIDALIDLKPALREILAVIVGGGALAFLLLSFIVIHSWKLRASRG